MIPTLLVAATVFNPVAFCASNEPMRQATPYEYSAAEMARVKSRYCSTLQKPVSKPTTQEKKPIVKRVRTPVLRPSKNSNRIYPDTNGDLKYNSYPD